MSELFKVILKSPYNEDEKGLSFSGQLIPATPEEIKEAMPDAMHWLPMSQDAVFEDGGIYLMKDKEDGSVGLATWMQSAYGFAMSIDYLENKERFTHYARITEPK